jgi:PAS domain S-box-containing protein
MARARQDTPWVPNPPLQAYLWALLAVAAVIGIGLTVYQQQVRLDRARTSAAGSVGMAARLSASDIGQAVTVARGSMAEVAANPGLAPLFDTPTPKGCTLSFSGEGPFSEGHIDIVNRAGTVLCSSRELPRGAPYADAGWLSSRTAQVVRSVDAGRPAVVVLAPVKDLGVAVTFLDADSVTTDLGHRYSGMLPVHFELVLDARTSTGGVGEHAIVRQAAVPSTGWTVRAGVAESVALRDASEVNRQMTLVLVLAMLLVGGLTQLLHLGIARPIRRLSSSVRRATVAGGAVEAPTSGPAEVVSLGRDFHTLTQDVASELAQRQRAEGEATASAEVYRTMFEANPQPTWVHTTETGRLIAVNAAMVDRFGWTRDELLAMRYQDLLERRVELREQLQGNGMVVRSGPWALSDKDGTEVDCLVTSDTLLLTETPGRIVVAEDVTVQLRTQRLLQRTERMESLGQLAGGIAHDFNNVLAVMLNYADFAADELAAAAAEDPVRWEPVLADVRQIGSAGDRAAALTRQLLSFARGDALETGTVDVNHVATGIDQLLRRTLGEQVSLELSLEPGLWPVNANVGQLEQIMVNLAVNARDAMPGGGQLSIETKNVDVDESYTSSRPARQPGRYVRLRVSDTGIGMDAQSRDRAFEPFFTTKDRAGGTGLGLATVYGIVKRAGGTVDIYSEPGIGTTVSMYVPVTESPAERSAAPAVPDQRAASSETLLLVEDDEALRSLAERILTGDGYHVLTADDGVAAQRVAEEHHGEIDLLLTDIVMPGMLGSELAERVGEADPGVRVLFMSGYAPPVLVGGGTLPSDAKIVDKPFSADLLLRKVRQVLEAQPS